MTAVTGAAPRPSKALIEHHDARSYRARILGPVLRVVLRPILELIPLTGWTLARLHLLDFVGIVLPLPTGGTAERRLFDGFDGELVTGAGVDATSDSVVLYFHGGGFLTCGLRSHRRLVARISTAAGVPVLQVNYRQLPAATLEQTIDDCLHVYRELLADGYRGDRIVFAGDSAGGYLAFAVGQRASAARLPSPAGIAALSPLVDLTGEHRARHRNAKTDAYLPVKKFARIVELLTGDGPPPTPLLNASYLAKLPPTLIQVGSREVLRCDAERMTAQLANAGVPCVLQIWDRQVHVFQVAADIIPEGRLAVDEIGAFVQGRLSKHHRPGPAIRMRYRSRWASRRSLRQKGK
jgi:acetyl esterase/lipase